MSAFLIANMAPIMFGALVVFLLSGFPVAFAQDTSADAPAHISVVEGTASLERDGRPEGSPASMPLLAGDRIRTGNGRVEVQFTQRIRGMVAFEGIDPLRVQIADDVERVRAALAG